MLNIFTQRENDIIKEYTISLRRKRTKNAKDKEKIK